MPRLARKVFVGLPHHVTHRGNRRSDIFFSGRDREDYLDLLQEGLSRHYLEIWSYCLMSNHIHLLAVPLRSDSLAKAIGFAHMMHARRINSRQGWTGHLWANRFYSSPVDPERAEVVARYIELNPVRAGIAGRPQDHRWSSARAHCLATQDDLLSGSRPIARDRDAWRRWLLQGTGKAEAAEIRRSTATGSPIGSDAFLERLEKVVGRRLRRRGYRSRRHGAQARSTKSS